MKYTRKILLAALMLVFVVTATHPYTYTCWTTMTGAKTFAVNPFFYAGDISALDAMSLDAAVGYGLSDNMDIFANLATLSPIKDFEYAGSWVMPRYALNERNIAALLVGYNTSDIILAPQYHYVRDMDRFAVEFNAALWLNSSDFGAGTVTACIGPVYKAVPDRLYPFLEINPSVSYGDTTLFDVNLAPGVWLGIKDTPHQFSLSVPLYGLKDGSVTAGLNFWYWWSFGGAGGAAQ